MIPEYEGETETSISMSELFEVFINAALCWRKKITSPKDGIVLWIRFDIFLEPFLLFKYCSFLNKNVKCRLFNPEPFIFKCTQDIEEIQKKRGKLTEEYKLFADTIFPNIQYIFS